MTDEPIAEPSQPALDPKLEEEQKAFEEHRAYLLSPEFTRRLTEHAQKAIRRVIEEGNKLQPPTNNDVHP